MAITTIDGANSGRKYVHNFVKTMSGTNLAGHPYSTFYSAGYPAAAAAPTPGIGGEVLTSYAGQIPFTNPTSGNTYLARLQAAASPTAYTLLLCDRLWHNSGIDLTSTSEQTFTGSARIPARDVSGTNNGVGVYAALEFSATGGAAAPVYTFKYTNSAGTTGQTATTIIASANSPAVGKFQIFSLASGDDGVQKAESLTLNTSQLSGTAHIVLFRVISRLDIQQVNFSNAADALTSGFPRIYDNSVPFLVIIPLGNNSVITGHTIFTQG